MSDFYTIIPIDIEAVTSKLPADAYVGDLKWDADRKQLKLHWSSRAMKTPFSVPIEFPLEDLKAKTVPVNVLELQWPSANFLQIASAETTPTPDIKLDTKRKRKDKGANA